MQNLDYFKEINIAVTICDAQGMIVYMNEKSKLTFKSDGGENSIGISVFDCHSQLSKDKIHFLMNTMSSNTYTIEKKGVKKIVGTTKKTAKKTVKKAAKKTAKKATKKKK